MPSSRKCILGCPSPQMLFGLSSNEERRLLWLKAINMEHIIQVGLYLCDRHFSGQNFSSSRHLKKTAIPDQNLTMTRRPAFYEESSKTSQLATLANLITTKEYNKIYAEGKLPTLLTNRNEKLPSTPKPPPCVKLPSSITVRPIENWKVQAETLRKTVEEKLSEVEGPVQKSNTELFYETKKYNNWYENSKRNYIRTYRKSTQTGSDEFQDCGVVRRFDNSNSFRLICYHCSLEFELRDWEIFINHINEKRDISDAIKTVKQTHLPDVPNSLENVNVQNVTTTVDETCVIIDPEEFMSNNLLTENAIMDIDNDIIEMCLSNSETEDTAEKYSSSYEPFNLRLDFKKNDSKEVNDNKKVLLDVEKTKTKEINKNEDFPNFENTESKEMNDSNEVFLDFENLEPNEINELNVTKTKLIEINEDENGPLLKFKKTETKELVENNEMFPADAIAESGAKKINYQNIIDFEKSDPEKILTFLTFFRNYPLLFNPQKNLSTQYENTVDNFLKNLGCSMTIEELNFSLVNVRAFHRRYNLCKEKKEITTEWKKYMDMTNEIASLAKSITYYCDHCTFYFLEEDSLLEHKFKQHKIGDNPFVCSCGLHCATVAKKKAHEMTHSTEPNFTCNHCGLSFLTKRKLENHMNIKHPEFVELRYKCEKCDAAFAKHYMYKWHSIKHDPPRFKCTICNKTYWSNYPFKNHMRTHSDKKDFICEICGAAFYNKVNVHSHRLLAHKDLFSYRCEYCKISFTTFDNQYTHNQKFHLNGSNPDRRKIMHSRNMKRYHDRLKAGKPPGRKKPEWKCKNCGAIFERLRLLQQHRREKNHYKGERSYKCPHCSSVLGSEISFLVHLRRMHKLPVKYSEIKYYESYPTAEDGDKDDHVSDKGDGDNEDFKDIEEFAYLEDEFAAKNISHAEECSQPIKVQMDLDEEFSQSEN